MKLNTRLLIVHQALEEEALREILLRGDFLAKAKAIVRRYKDNLAPSELFGPNGPLASATNAMESGILTLFFNNTAYANVGDAVGIRGSTTAGSHYISLHTADPGETGSQTTSEIGYTNYARQAVARSSAGFTISATAPTQAANAALVSFPACGVTGGTATYFGVGSDVSGAGNLFCSAALTASLIINAGITPNFAIGTLVVTLD